MPAGLEEVREGEGGRGGGGGGVCLVSFLGGRLLGMLGCFSNF